MVEKRYRRYKHILFDEPKPHKEYIEFWRSPNPEKLALEKGYTVDEKLKKLLDVIFVLFVFNMTLFYDRLLTYL